MAGLTERTNTERTNTGRTNTGRTNVRVTCIVPDWVRTPRAEAELAAMTAHERAARPALIPLPVLTDTVADLVRNDDLAGHVVVLRPGQPPRALERT